MVQMMPMRLTGFAVGLVTTSAGIAAACGSDWTAAEQHFQAALRQAHEIPYKIAQPEARRWYAWMLSERNAPGDNDRARTLLGQATEMYRTIGMPKHVELAEHIREAALVLLLTRPLESRCESHVTSAAKVQSLRNSHRSHHSTK